MATVADQKKVQLMQSERAIYLAIADKLEHLFISLHLNAPIAGISNVKADIDSIIDEVSVLKPVSQKTKNIIDGARIRLIALSKGLSSKMDVGTLIKQFIIAVLPLNEQVYTSTDDKDVRSKFQLVLKQLGDELVLFANQRKKEFARSNTEDDDWLNKAA